jgi:hypothetical protein
MIMVHCLAGRNRAPLIAVPCRAGEPCRAVLNVDRLDENEIAIEIAVCNQSALPSVDV